MFVVKSVERGPQGMDLDQFPSTVNSAVANLEKALNGMLEQGLEYVGTVDMNVCHSKRQFLVFKTMERSQDDSESTKTLREIRASKSGVGQSKPAPSGK